MTSVKRVELIVVEAFYKSSLLLLLLLLLLFLLLLLLLLLVVVVVVVVVVHDCLYRYATSRKFTADWTAIYMIVYTGMLTEGNIGETHDRRGGAHMGLSERIYTILN